MRICVRQQNFNDQVREQYTEKRIIKQAPHIQKTTNDLLVGHLNDLENQKVYKKSNQCIFDIHIVEHVQMNKKDDVVYKHYEELELGNVF